MLSMNSSESFVVRNRTRGATLAEYVRLADTPRSRRVGLLKRDKLDPGEGLWIYPTQAIHTFGMRFSIDVSRTPPTVDGRPLVFYHFHAFKAISSWVFDDGLTTYGDMPREVRAFLNGM